jgi:hypothetical protein
MGRWLTNRAETSYLSFRRRARARLQKVASDHALVFNHSATECQLQDRTTDKGARAAAFAVWCGLPVA